MLWCVKNNKGHDQTIDFCVLLIARCSLAYTIVNVVNSWKFIFPLFGGVNPNIPQHLVCCTRGSVLKILWNLNCLKNDTANHDANVDFNWHLTAVHKVIDKCDVANKWQPSCSVLRVYPLGFFTKKLLPPCPFHFKLADG